MAHRSSYLLPLVLACGLISPAAGQRVQFPTGSGFDTFGAPSTFQAPATSPFAAGGMPAPTLSTTPPTATLGSPMPFDPYSLPSVSGGTMPSAAPYGMPPAGPYNGWPTAPVAQTAPPAWQPYGAPPQATGGIYNQSLPYDWQQGSQGYVGSDGTQVSWQRLLERIGFEHTWLGGGNSDDDLGWHRTEVAATFAYPLFHNIETPLFITPGFAFNFLDGPGGDPTLVPRGPDLPGQVYDAYVDFSWYPRFSPRFGAELGVRTGVWTDFDHVTTDSIRILGRGLAVITVTPQHDVLVGVVYIDRLRYSLLPAGGVRYRPSPDWDFYLVFPNPKIRGRLPSLTVGEADWHWYVGGEYGGGSWTVDRSGMGDRFDYNDIRVVLGMDWERTTNLRGHFEVGYAFDREVVFESGMPPEASLDNTFMLRGGVDF